MQANMDIIFNYHLIDFIAGEGCEEFVEALKEMYGVTTTMPT